MQEVRSGILILTMICIMIRKVATLMSRIREERKSLCKNWNAAPVDLWMAREAFHTSQHPWIRKATVH
jgi:hypothetical protein